MSANCVGKSFRRTRDFRLAHATLALVLICAANPFIDFLPQAKACTTPSCAPGLVAPAKDFSVPANAPAFPVRAEWNPFRDAGTPVGEIQLLNDAKEIVPTTVTELLAFSPDRALVPTAVLVPGSYFFRRTDSCTVLTPAVEDLPFTVTEAKPLPTTAGTVEVSTPRFDLALQVFTSGGSCTVALPASVVDLTFHPSDDLAPFLSIARIQVDVDGKLWASPFWGRQTAASRSPYEMVSHIPLSPYSACGGTSFDDRGLPAGPHSGNLTIFLPTIADPLPPIPFTFTTSCPPATGDSSNSSNSGGCSVVSSSAPWSKQNAGMRASSLSLLLGGLCLVRRRRPRSRRG